MPTRKSAGSNSKPAPPPAKKPRTDWDAVHRDFRTGKFTHQELADKYGVSRAAVTKQARVNGWRQDLGEQIRQATNAKVAELVASEVAEGSQKVTDTVLAAAELNKQVIVGHRGELSRGRDHARDLMEELEQGRMLAEEQELLVAVIAREGATQPELEIARRAVQKALALPTRVSAFKAWAEAVTKLHASERVAYGLDEKEDDDAKSSAAQTIADFIGGIHGANVGRLQFAPPKKA